MLVAEHEEYVGLEEKTEFAGAGGIRGRQGKVALSEEVPERGKETAILWGASYASQVHHECDEEFYQ